MYLAFLERGITMKIKITVLYLGITYWRCTGYWSRGSGLVISVQDCH